MPPTQFLLPDNWDIRKSIELISAGFNTTVEPEHQVKLTYYDSFDWRLYLGGVSLVQEVQGRERRLRLEDLTQAQNRYLQPSPTKVPAFVDQLPDSPLRQELAALLEMRALIPLVEVHQQITVIRLLDNEQKTVLRLRLEAGQATEAGKRAFSSLGIRLTLLPVRGYDRALAKMQAYLIDEFELLEADTLLLQQALTKVGRAAGDYSSKLNFALQPDARSDVVAKQIHLHLLDTLERNISGTKQDIDSEFLHDLRVAVRRTRSALTQIKGVFTEEEIERFKSRLAWIGQITGATRDLDVYLLDFRDYQRSLPEAFQQDLEPLHHYLVAHQKLEQRAMVRKINSPHFRILLKEWREFLEAPVPEISPTPKGNVAIESLADKRIYRMFNRVLDEGLAINQDSPHEMLHELRKSCKKLRYLLEFFQSLYPAKEVKGLVKVLKILLNNLGDFQDLEVQAYKLREFAHDMVKEGDVPADTLLAMGMLVDGLLKRQQQARDEFAGRFAVFADEDNRANYQQLFAPKKKRAKTKV
ncbi:MAG: CHAD domain-containing protein [Chromatiales bacterium]|nr:CHAD domain-containing protein [Chromatiales bacterium]